MGKTSIPKTGFFTKNGKLIQVITGSRSTPVSYLECFKWVISEEVLVNASDDMIKFFKEKENIDFVRVKNLKVKV